MSLSISRITDVSFGVHAKDTNAEIEFGIWDDKNDYIIIVGELFFVRRTNSGESPQNHGAPVSSQPRLATPQSLQRKPLPGSS